MTKNELSFSVIIPTFKRPYLLDCVLEGLEKQTYKDFEVTVVVKPSGDETEEIIDKHRKTMNIKTVLQKEGYIVDALNLGLRNVKSDVIAFLDDDAVPFVDWVERHLETYKELDVGGLAGDIVPAVIHQGKLRTTNEQPVAPSGRGLMFWNWPVEGLEDYKHTITRAGYFLEQGNYAYWRKRGIVKSLLGIGANMSVLNKAIESFRFQKPWILGCHNEQFMAWHIWQQGYDIVFNPAAKVYHVVHGETLSRDVFQWRIDVLWQVEQELLFYRLYGDEKLSIICRTLALASRVFDSLINLRKNRTFYVNRLKAVYLGNLIGLKWLISKMTRGIYNPIKDLEQVRARYE